MTGVLPPLDRVIGHSGGVLDTLMPMHLWLDQTARLVQTGPTILKMLGLRRRDGDGLVGRSLFEIVTLRRPVAAQSVSALDRLVGRRLTLCLSGTPQLPLRGSLARLPGEAGFILDISLGLSFARAVAEFDLTMSDFSPCDQTVELLYLHEANRSTAALSRRLSERLDAARAAAEAQALTDAMTGLANRRAMDALLSRALGEQGTDLALLHIDLDLFKQVNDSLGHAAGDHVLAHVGRILKREFRPADRVGRVGGDEFLAIVTDCTSPDALGSIADRLIAELEQPIPFDGKTCHISASIGIACTADYVQRPDPDQFLNDADLALYRAKRGGRGRYSLFSAPGPEVPPGRRVSDPKAGSI